MKPASAGTTVSLEVQVARGPVVESRHRVHGVVVNHSGTTLSWGDPNLRVWLRSAAKPFQAMPLIEDGAADQFGLSEEEIAVCCGSHNSEEAHIAVVRSILDKAGVPERLIGCGPHPPLLAARREAMAEDGTRPTPVMSNCSGKHAGMLALAAFHGWPLNSYMRPGHPVQRRMRREVARWTGVDPAGMPSEADGCGVPTFSTTLRDLAEGSARLSAACASPGPAQRVLGAMTRVPFMVAGSERLCTRLMEVERGAVFAKVGAEAIYMAGHLESGTGVALKVEDGAWRAAPPALLAVLDRAGVLAPGTIDALADFAEPVIRNTLGDVVGRMRIREVPCS